MNSNRRSFIRLGSLAVGASCFLRPRSLFGFGAEKGPGVLSFDAAELRTLDFIASYSSAARIIGASVLGRMHPDSNCGMHVLVEVNNFVKLADALPRAPFKNIFANANALSFSSLGSAGVIENLSPGDFAARLAELGGKDNIVFAHDAIVYDPIAKTLDDPFGALNVGELKLINRPAKTPAALEVALRGTGEALAAGIPEGESFAKWKAQLLKSSAHSTAAQPIAAAFVRKLPAFAALAGTDNVKSALGTPLISSAVESALGLSSRTVIGEFDRVRAIFGQSYSDGAVWLYVLLGQQVKKDTRGWITTDLLEDAHWREAFTNAGLIEQAFQSPELKSQA
jgi:hypothetical protein